LPVRWLTLALDDLDHIVEFVARDKPSAAKRIAEALWKAGQRLVEHPAMGRPGRVTGTREWVIPGTPYIMAYRVRDDVIEILRVLHSAMDWPSEFG